MSAPPQSQRRTIAKCNPKQDRKDKELGPLALLSGYWESLPGRGWNMIALPFAKAPFNYRLLLNQYNEDLDFVLVDKGVPNRGILRTGNATHQADQRLAALDYVQKIVQIAAADSPESGEAGDPGLPIHHEPGLFLYIRNEQTDGLDIARQASIPHGNSVLALGRSSVTDGAPDIPDISGLPIGVAPVGHDSDPDATNCLEALLDRRYLAPYKHFHDNPFENLFDPVHPNALLKAANNGVEIERTTTLTFDTTFGTGGIHNIPFIERQADAAEMRSTFWIQELKEKDENGDPKLRMQYSQVIFLDFFPRADGMPGLIRWPHVSINTLVKVPTGSYDSMPGYKKDKDGAIS